MKFQDIEIAFDFVSMDQPYMHTAYVSRTTGKTYFNSEMGDFDEFPKDIEDNDDYVAIPHKNDLDLGKRLVWKFVAQEIPGFTDKLRIFFSRRGAYSRYKEFLVEIGLLEKWYEFEDSKTKEALLKWCNENKIEIDG